MTPLLQQAFCAAAALPAEDQDAFAARWLAELNEEEAFDLKLASTAHRLTSLAEEALAEYHAGQTEALDADKL
jgi:hypothetical protein